MDFIKYIHLERFGTDEVDGINVGDCHIFPKIDGTNASFWFDGEFRCGSRNRVLSLDDDNAGFMAWAVLQGGQLASRNARLAHDFKIRPLVYATEITSQSVQHRAPLTLEQIGDLEFGQAGVPLTWDQRVTIVRAAERAHGITAAPKEQA